jgi:hypothetical protein
MKRRNLYLLSSLLLALSVNAQSGDVSGLNKKEFDKYWRMESEAANYNVSFRGDTAEIVAPKGLTLWRKEKMKGRVTVEYDACVVVENEGDRLSDLNCFWMASDPQKEDIWQRAAWRQGVFLNCYSLQLYYLGYGGNGNSTTRFRRYDGNEEGVSNAAKRPAILKEYTDAAHLLKANHWYHVKITNEGNRVCYYIDGERLVDFRDAEPLTEGWFGFRTTLSRTRITNFKYTMNSQTAVAAPLHWIGNAPAIDKAVSFGVPFRQGEVMPDERLQLTTADGKVLTADTWAMAYWPDGSVKWSGVATVVPASTEGVTLTKAAKAKSSSKSSKQKAAAKGLTVNETADVVKISTGVMTASISRHGDALIDSLVYGGVKVAEHGRLVCSTQSSPLAESTGQITYKNYTSSVKSVSVERAGDVRALVKIEGTHCSADGREWLPFIVRLYFYAGSNQIKMVHSFVFDGDQNADFIHSLGVRFDVPMREALYNRHVAFSCADGGVWSEPVQPLVGRRMLMHPDYNGSSLQKLQMEGERIPDAGTFDAAGQTLLKEWAAWDGFRLSQLTADGFSIRKRANDNNPWIGTLSGSRATGYTFVGDVTGGLGISIDDFWQAYPSSMEISGAKSDKAEMTAWLWSPDAEPMDLRHYDNVAHGLNSSYEDVQEGMSTPYGVARTTSLLIVPQGGYAGKADFAKHAALATEKSVMMATPEYLHDSRAFGIWSLPDTTTAFRSKVENRLNAYIDLYKSAIEQNSWYGFWNYGDVMHAYDPVRHEWRYDVGGFAWDNTELASNMWLWYDFLRTGRADIWRMAEAMGRHTAEVDVYHLGPNAGLGSRHNVSHWGCGAKEARISQAAWNRFYYYLTTDERCGDLMTEVKDADQKLYELDPMRLAQPREQYPCTAPARLRIGPDWLAYAGNWMTEWERTGNTAYRDKIMAGMKSIVALPNRMFTGPLALGYDPATGIITTECDPKLETTNHLMTIMGGFEVMNEMMPMMNYPEWNDAWLDLATNYKRKALEIRQNRFRVARLMAYSAYVNRNNDLANEAWTDLFGRLEHTPAPEFKIEKVLPPEVPAPIDECATISTNDAALWSLDAIYMQEVIPQ